MKGEKIKKKSKKGKRKGSKSGWKNMILWRSYSIYNRICKSLLIWIKMHIYEEKCVLCIYIKLSMFYYKQRCSLPYNMFVN